MVSANCEPTSDACGTNPATDLEEAKVDKMIGSICPGCSQAHPDNGATKIGVRHVVAHETVLDCSCGNTWNCRQWIFGNTRPFCFASFPSGNAEPFRFSAACWRSCSRAFRRAIDDRYRDSGRSGELLVDRLERRSQIGKFPDRRAERTGNNSSTRSEPGARRARDRSIL